MVANYFFDFQHRNSLLVVTSLNNLLLSQHLKELWFDHISDQRFINRIWV